MGNGQATAYAEMVATEQIGLEIALTAHLTSNHWPSLPYAFAPLAKEAIELYNSGEHDTMVSLEDTEYSHRVFGKEIPVLDCIEMWNLDAFLNCDEEW